MRFTLVLALSLAACGGSTAAPADAGNDLAADVAVIPDAGAPCDVGAPPASVGTLPMLRSQLVILGGDGGASSFPTPSGGDPAGTWVMTAVTMYLPAGARGQVVTEQSAIAGTGWAVLEGGRFRIATSLELTLETVMVGRVRRPVGIVSQGAFTQRGAALELAPTCAPTAMMGTTLAVGFSRDAGDRGRLHVTAAGMLGTTMLVFDMERR